MFRLIGRLLIVLGFAGSAVSAFAGQITDIVTVNGKDWAQADLFIGLSWSDINTVCPSGICLDGGLLNGYNMTGWQWAFTDDVNALLNYYIGSPQMGPGPDIYSEYPGSFAASFFSGGWRATQNQFSDSRETVGLMSDNSANVGLMAEWTGVVSVANTNFSATDPQVIEAGAWFHRDVQIPAPATLSLLGLGLAALCISRRRRLTP
jgi:hypothetical protein